MVGKINGSAEASSAIDATTLPRRLRASLRLAAKISPQLNRARGATARPANVCQPRDSKNGGASCDEVGPN